MMENPCNLNASPYWLATPFGQRVMAWETKMVQQMTSTLFGMTALKMGLSVDGLQPNAVSGVQVQGILQANTLQSGSPNYDSSKNMSVLLDPLSLPFHAGSMDLILAHHVLEMHDEPEALLREWNRVLSLDGHLVLTLFNPYSSLRYAGWMHQQFSQKWRKLTAARLKDWLQLLGLSLQQATYGVYTPPWQTYPRWFQYLPKTSKDDDKQHRLDQWDAMGNRWWPSLGAVVVIVAQKRMLRLTRVTKVRPWVLKPKLQTANYQVISQTSPRPPKP